MTQIAAASTDLTIFARVKDGEIVEFPVYRIHIVNRGHPFHWYTPVYEETKPELPPFHRHVHSFEIMTSHVLMKWSTKPYTLAELLSQLKPRPDPMNPTEEPAIPLISELDPALVQHIHAMTSDYVTSKLSEFAATRGYGTATIDPFASLIGYKDSTIPKFASEAARGLLLRDQAWVNTMQYFDQLVQGQVPVPTSITEIDALLPEMKWPDQD